MRRIRQKRERGSATVEFCFSALVWLPLLLGTAMFGFALIQAIQISQLSRDTGRMYAYGIDFTTTQNAALLGRLAASLNIQQSGGSGAILLSTITLVTDTDCTAALQQKPCPNNGQYVFTKFTMFGNAAYVQTQLGNPGMGYIRNGNSITIEQYLSDITLRATNFSNFLHFVADQPGQYAYVSEVTLNSNAIVWSDFTNMHPYARTIF